MYKGRGLGFDLLSTSLVNGVISSADLPHMVGTSGTITIAMPTSERMGVVKSIASSRHLPQQPPSARRHSAYAWGDWFGLQYARRDVSHRPKDVRLVLLRHNDPIAVGFTALSRVAGAVDIIARAVVHAFVVRPRKQRAVLLRRASVPVARS